MNTAIIVGAVIVIAALVIVAYLWQSRISDQRHQEFLQKKYGPEYDRLVTERGDRRAAVRELEMREQRVRGYSIRPASPEQWQQFSQSWQQVQAEFVDDPAKSVEDADGLVNEVLDARGYPRADFDQRIADLSVDHPDLVAEYREAHAIALSDEEGTARTEDLRTAMVRYRDLFQELLGREPVGAMAGNRTTTTVTETGVPVERTDVSRDEDPDRLP
jgi:FtsZ-interacting cell division protein ZipA